MFSLCLHVRQFAVQSLPSLSPVNQIQPAYRLATRLLRTVPVGNLIWLLLPYGLSRNPYSKSLSEYSAVLLLSSTNLSQTGIFHLPLHKDTFPEEELLLPPTKLFQDDSFLPKPAILPMSRKASSCVLQTECSALHRTTKYAD